MTLDEVNKAIALNNRIIASNLSSPTARYQASLKLKQLNQEKTLLSNIKPPEPVKKVTVQVNPILLMKSCCR